VCCLCNLCTLLFLCAFVFVVCSLCLLCVVVEWLCVAGVKGGCVLPGQFGMQGSEDVPVLRIKDSHHLCVVVAVGVVGVVGVFIVGCVGVVSCVLLWEVW